MGNLARRGMNRVSGASGPALVMRGVFAHLNRDGQTRPLPHHAALVRRVVCADDGLAPHADCQRTREEWFAPQRPSAVVAPSPATARGARIRQPSAGLTLAMDPRLPAAAQRLRFDLAPGVRPARVEWIVDDELLAQSAQPHWSWPITRGHHRVRAVVYPASGGPGQSTPTVLFQVH
jgi:penicillin-binding protein 1C